MDDTRFDPGGLRAAMRAVDEQEAAAYAPQAKQAAEQPAAPEVTATDLADRMVDLHREAIERHQFRVLAIRRECSVEIRKLDDELFEAERAFIELRGRIERQKAEAEAKAARDIDANRRMAKASQDALVALTSVAEA